MKLIYIVFCLLLLSTVLSAQTYISGDITNEETGEVLEYANIVFYKNGVYYSGTSADLNGHYYIFIKPGTYDVEASYIGMKSKKIKNVVIHSNKENNLNIVFTKEEEHYSSGCGLVTIRYKIPLIEQDNTTTGKERSSEEIKNMPTKNIHEISALTPGVSL